MSTVIIVIFVATTTDRLQSAALSPTQPSLALFTDFNAKQLQISGAGQIEFNVLIASAPQTSIHLL